MPDGAYLHQPQRVVLKFPAPHRGRTITVTEGAVVVLVDHQEGVPTLWVELVTARAEGLQGLPC